MSDTNARIAAALGKIGDESLRHVAVPRQGGIWRDTTPLEHVVDDAIALDAAEARLCRWAEMRSPAWAFTYYRESGWFAEVTERKYADRISLGNYPTKLDAVIAAVEQETAT